MLCCNKNAAALPFGSATAFFYGCFTDFYGNSLMEQTVIRI